MNSCPECGSSGSYVGLNSVECPNNECRHFAPALGPGYDETIVGVHGCARETAEKACAVYYGYFLGYGPKKYDWTTNSYWQSYYFKFARKLMSRCFAQALRNMGAKAESGPLPVEGLRTLAP